jgi:hypothetical protein
MSEKFKTRAESSPSGGVRIDDHSFFAGGPSKESPMPMQSKMKQTTSAANDGNVTRYEDTDEAIKAQQDENARKAKAHASKFNYRN